MGNVLQPSGPLPLLLVPAACLLLACGTGEPVVSAVGLTTDVRDEGGITRVTNEGTPPRWEAEEVLRLGALEGAGPEVFGAVRSVVADVGGNVYVADGQAREIRVFAPDGRHLRTLGREGAGPGEFRNLVGLAWLGETLAAMDPGNARIQLLTADGESTGTREATGATGPATLFHPRRVGDAEFWVPDIVVGDRGGLERVFVRHTAEGPADTLPGLSPPEGAPSSGILCRGEDFFATFRFPSAPELVFGFAGDARRLASWTDAYRFAALDEAGDTARTVRWSRPAVPIDDDAWEEETADFREFRQERRSADCEPAAPRRPPHRATLRHLMTDDAGRIWAESAAPDGFVWDVFDPDGRWLAEVELPERHAGVPPYVRDGTVYQVERDDLDLEYVAAYRITDDGR